MGDRVLAIDIGGTKLACGLIDDVGTIEARSTVPTGEGTDGEAMFATLAALIDEVLASGGTTPVACGVGTGGPMTGGGASVSPVNIEAWRDFPLLDRLRTHTGLATTIDNDAKALALGEGWLGAAVGVRDYLAMVVSTGVGGGIVLDGRLLDGDDGNAGHIGHVIVEPDGAVCGCGARGCLEAEASGTAIAKATGRPPAEADDEVRRRTGRLVGRGVASVANLLDLDLVLVAGSVALGFGEPFFTAAQEEIDQRCRIEFSRDTVIHPGGLGADGPLVGAAAVAWRALGQVPGLPRLSVTAFPDLLPMKAVSGDLPPDDDEGWAYEIKWDGMRLLAYVDPGGPVPLRMQTTRGHDAAPRWPELAAVVDAVGRPVLDGEVVAFDDAGRSDFGRLQTRQFPVTFIVFDLLWFDGNDLVTLPYLDRRRFLTEVVDLGDEATAWRVPSHILGEGHTLFEHAKTAGLEGLIAKRTDSPYLPGKRSTAWRKVKVRRGQEMVVGGWLPGEGNRSGSLGALLVGHYDDTGLRYAGRVGTGFNAAELARLQPRLDERAADESPFVDELPAPVRKAARFVRPELVAQVEFAEWTTEGRLRHPAYIAERDDKDPRDVVREP